MFKPKVLVACATYDGAKKYLSRWLDGVESQTYSNYEIVFCDNSKTNDYAEELAEYGVVLRAKPDIIHRALEESYNKLRDYFLENNYDLMWILEADQIPESDALERLIEANKPVVGCPYLLNKNNEIVCVHDYATEQIMNYTDIKLAAEKNILLRVWGCGHGCVLATRDVITKIPFRIEDAERPAASPDTYWYQDLKKNNIPVYCLVNCWTEHLRLTEEQFGYPDGIKTIKLDKQIVVTCKGDFWNSGLSSGKIFVMRGQLKVLPKVIDFITYEAIQSGLLIEVDPVKDEKARELLEQERGNKK